MNEEQKEFYNAQIGSPLQIAVKDNEPLQKQIEEMIEACKRMVREEMREKVVSLLGKARCPDQDCDNNGTIACRISEDEWEPQQCQWCYEKKAFLSTLS